MPRLFFSRRAERQLQRLPGEVRMHLETHLENLTLLLGSAVPLGQVLARLERNEEGFVTTVEGMRLSFALDTVLRVILVHCISPVETPPAPEVPDLHGAQPAT
ncbi:hypothetical protein [Pyxidicoccus sp. MSG2]|uniref:hypothetical protein n=1 Tax=Pyxidicoccus sp. MSG2 TaxID=2996790 RepID=UPI002270AFED|nr:hypothetical protein [Pyxidicoccus sp. MSG2]MCY1022371.1 hypothetical protein [Pyxidicoccus sp. MSG2]